MDWTSVRQCAERLNITHPAILRAIKDGRVRAEAVRRNGHGRIVSVDVDQVARDMQLNSDPLQASRHRGELVAPISRNGEARGEIAGAAHGGTNNPAHSGAPGFLDPAGIPEQGSAATGSSEPPHEASGNGLVGASGKDPHGYYEARAKREQTLARQAELDLQKALGLLVSTEEMKQVGARRYKILRDKFINLADRVSPLVPEQFRTQVWAAIDKEVKRTLHELSHDAAAEAAGRAAERVAA